MPRRVARPYGGTVSPTRLVSLLFAVALLYVFYDRAKDADTWRRFTGEQAADEAEPQGAKGPDWAKIDANLAPGPNDRNPAEKEKGDLLLGLVRDKTPLQAKEMAAYWTLMNWSRAEPFRELEKRAQREPPFIQIWEQPARYRGELIRLRMHATRVLDFKSDERNGDPARTVYEAWGWTDNSKSFPYVVVFPDLPEGLPTGDKIQGEIVFVGYFLKNMSYTATDATRGAPLLIGRARLAVAPSATRHRVADGGFSPWLIAATVGAAAIIGFGLWSALRGRRPQRTELAEASGPPDPDLGLDAPDPRFRFDLSPPPDRGILPPAPPRPDEPS